MREICTSGSMSGERKRDEDIKPTLPRLSSTLLRIKCGAVAGSLLAAKGSTLDRLSAATGHAARR